jgi:hypothetical protein
MCSALFFEQKAIKPSDLIVGPQFVSYDEGTEFLNIIYRKIMFKIL